MNTDDRDTAHALALRLVAAGAGRVRRVVVIGSRACGKALPGSDLDLVSVLETPAGDGPWSMARMAGERQRIISTLGMPPIPTDLWLLSSDQYEEGRRVFGGIEYFAEREGVTVFDAPLQRAPVVRRSPEMVRRHNVRAWMEDAVNKLQKVLDATARALLADATGARSRAPEPAAIAVVEKAVMALCVLHGIPSSTKGKGLGRSLTDLAVSEPVLAPWISAQLTGSFVDAAIGLRVVRAVLAHAAGSPGMDTLLAGLTTRLGGFRMLVPSPRS